MFSLVGSVWSLGVCPYFTLYVEFLLFLIIGVEVLKCIHFWIHFKTSFCCVSTTIYIPRLSVYSKKIICRCTQDKIISMSWPLHDVADE